MKLKYLVSASVAAFIATAALVPTVASAAPHRHVKKHGHQVCHWDRHHRHRVCRWVR